MSPTRTGREPGIKTVEEEPGNGTGANPNPAAEEAPGAPDGDGSGEIDDPDESAGSCWKAEPAMLALPVEREELLMGPTAVAVMAPACPKEPPVFGTLLLSAPSAAVREPLAPDVPKLPTAKGDSDGSAGSADSCVAVPSAGSDVAVDAGSG